MQQSPKGSNVSVKLPDMTSADGNTLERLHDIPITHEALPLYNGILRKKLYLQTCNDCGHWQHPPRTFCQQCWSDDIGFAPVSGRGHVFMMMWLFQGPPSYCIDNKNPFAVATVQLQEQTGLRYSAQLLGAVPRSWHIGAPVRLDWVVRNKAPWPAFTLADP
jgi:uncharacterized OB-fold protein